MKVVGIDGSTFHLDLVKLDLDSDRAEWTRHSLPNERLAWDRIQAARALPLGGTYWDDVCLVGVEQPAGRGDSPLLISFTLGVLLAHVPERIPVLRLMPSEWRRHCGLPGNCPKEQAASWADSRMQQADGSGINDSAYRFTKADMTPVLDAYDAFCIAYAARAINESAASVAEGNQTQEETA